MRLRYSGTPCTARLFAFGSTIQEVIIAGETTDLLAAMIYTDDASHGRCSSVYVGIVPSTEQITALTTYSAQFKVCIVVLAVFAPYPTYLAWNRPLSVLFFFCSPMPACTR